MITTKFVPTGNGCGYYVVYYDGEFIQTCDVGELSEVTRSLKDQ